MMCQEGSPFHPPEGALLFCTVENVRNYKKNIPDNELLTVKSVLF